MSVMLLRTTIYGDSNKLKKVKQAARPRVAATPLVMGLIQSNKQDMANSFPAHWPAEQLKLKSSAHLPHESLIRNASAKLKFSFIRNARYAFIIHKEFNKNEKSPVKCRNHIR